MKIALNTQQPTATEVNLRESDDGDMFVLTKDYNNTIGGTVKAGTIVLNVYNNILAIKEDGNIRHWASSSGRTPSGTPICYNFSLRKAKPGEGFTISA